MQKNRDRIINTAVTYSKETTKKAAALSYNKDSTPPKLVAKGINLSANQILEIAKENNVPIYQNDQLLKILMGLEIDSYIPIEIYSVVAEIINEIYKKDQEISNNKNYGF